MEFVGPNALWHARLSGNFAVEESVDRSMLAVFDEKVIMVVKSEDGEILGSASLEPNTHVAWPRIAWSPSGKRIAVSYTNNVRILDVEKGEWTLEYSSTGGPVCPNALSYPHDDFLLLDNHLLVHLPSRIQVCDYRDAGPIKTVGGTAFIGMLADSGGLWRRENSRTRRPRNCWKRLRKILLCSWSIRA